MRPDGVQTDRQSPLILAAHPQIQIQRVTPHLLARFIFLYERVAEHVFDPQTTNIQI